MQSLLRKYASAFMTTVNTDRQCSVVGCDSKSASFRCSKCKKVYYCSSEHQKIDWKSHKKLCFTPAESKNSQTLHDSNRSDISSESRISRCMFCGESLVLSSEEDAVSHMRCYFYLLFTYYLNYAFFFNYYHYGPGQ